MMDITTQILGVTMVGGTIIGVVVILFKYWEWMNRVQMRREQTLAEVQARHQRSLQEAEARAKETTQAPPAEQAVQKELEKRDRYEVIKV